MIGTSAVRRLMAGTLVLAAGCGSTMMDTELATQLLSVSPRGGSVNVPLSADIVLTFNQAMMAGMEQYVALHQGTITGPPTPMNCNWSDGQRTLTCRLAQPLTAAARYTVHIGGGMMNNGGQRVGMDRNGTRMGGQWAMGGMMAGRADMMGTGWMHPNGSYGMVFEFTTQ